MFNFLWAEEFPELAEMIKKRKRKIFRWFVVNVWFWKFEKSPEAEDFRFNNILINLIVQTVAPSIIFFFSLY